MMSEMKKQIEHDKKTKEQLLEEYYDKKTDDFARSELSRRMLKSVQDSARLRAAELAARLRPHTKGPGRNVLIKIKGRQWDAQSKPDEITLTTHGKYYTKNGSHYIVYRESAESGYGETSTTLIYSPDGSARLTRVGEHQMRMHFVEGKREITHYSTPFGRLNLGFYTNIVDFRVTAKGGTLKLSYNLDASTQVELNTNLELQFSFL